MRGGQDLGGRQGLGPIDPEPEAEEPVFHSDWERRAFALTLASGMLGQWNIDESRYARENQHPADYLQHSYYENWLAGLETLLLEKGLLTESELNQLPAISRRPPSNGIRQKQAAAVDASSLRVPNSSDALKILASGGPTAMAETVPPRFAVGDPVRVRRWYTAGHTRAPDYVQGCVGVIARCNGCHVYPDDNARGEHRGEHLYSVRFSLGELWSGAEASDSAYVDLWEPYLDVC